ncbi:hypothetical protein [Nonomuraea salmonea]|uniref:hypothetical protein n=1 Tax=Nonomuraea salmonea TaxID=46181 RepID=UPI0031EA08E6
MAGLGARPARILIAALSGVLAVLVGTGVWIAAQARDEQGRSGDRQAALAAAGEHAKNLMSLDHKSVDADVRRILDTSTGGRRRRSTRPTSASSGTPRSRTRSSSTACSVRPAWSR